MFDDIIKQRLEKEKPYLLRKKLTCPMCLGEFRGLGTKTGRIRRVGADIDLRPINEPVDALKYSINVCSNCGYHGLGKTFKPLSQGVRGLLKRAQLPKPDISGIEEKEYYTYNEALEMCRVALEFANARQADASEKAYLELTMAWLDRGRVNELESIAKEDYENKKKDGDEEAKDPTPLIDAIKAQASGQEKAHLKAARDGFTEAMAKEMPPFVGMDTSTLDFLIAVLSYEVEDYSMALIICSRILTNKGSSSRLKDKARDLKDLVREAKGDEEE